MPPRKPPPRDDAAPSKENLDACRRCELWEPATQGVPGEGDSHARVVLVGEQPGHDEDLAGRPFVGPAGRLLRELLAEAGLGAGDVYITNAVKHFRFEVRGKRRLHKTPLQRHVAACHAWLESELAALEPRVVVALGSTALAALVGGRLSIAAARETDLTYGPGDVPVVATYHPSAVLRVPDPDGRAQLRDALLADLLRAARLAKRRAP